MRVTIYWTAIVVFTVFILSTLMVLSQILAGSQYNPVDFFKLLLFGTIDCLLIGVRWLTYFRVVRVDHPDP